MLAAEAEGNDKEKKAQNKTMVAHQRNGSLGRPTVEEKAGNSSNGTANEAVMMVPEEILSFEHCIITPELASYAAAYLNETEETRNNGLKEMREILKSDPDIKFIDEDNFLLIFLRSKKFDAKRSAEFFKLGLSYIESYRHMLERSDPKVLRRVVATDIIGYLRYRDQKGRAIIYCRADRWIPSEITAGEAILSGVITVQSAIHNPVNQVAGFVVVFDLKHLKIQQVFAMSRWMIFGTLTLQRACPCFMKAFHCINVPPIYKIGWKLVKPLLSEKIRKRFIFHKSSDLSTLYEHLPQEVLPPELGGNVPFSNAHWARNIDKVEQQYNKYLSKNFYISKRKKTPS